MSKKKKKKKKSEKEEEPLKLQGDLSRLVKSSMEKSKKKDGKKKS